MACRKYSKAYANEEESAKVARRGIWRGRFSPPLKWRWGERLGKCRGALITLVVSVVVYIYGLRAPLPFFAPSRSGRLPRNLFAFLSREFFGPCLPAFQPTQATQGHSMRVLVLILGRFLSHLSHLAFRGRLDYVGRQEVQIAGPFLIAFPVRHNPCKMSRLGPHVKGFIQTDPLPKHSDN